MTSEEILQQLAEQTDGIREFVGPTFESLEEYWAICDARLSAFSSEKMWVVAIEVIGYNRGGEYSLRVWLFGNCLQSVESDYQFERPIFDTPNAWNHEIEKNQIWGLACDGFALQWRGKRFDFAPSLEELQAAGIELSHREKESGLLSPQQMLRYVCEKLDHPFFLGEDALRDLLDQNALPLEWKYDQNSERSWYQNELGEFDEMPLLSVCLELILQTRDWVHPKLGLADGEAGEWEISPHDAFETLAKTLATRDFAIWSAQDASKFNSHWRNWAVIEAEEDRIAASHIEAGKVAFRAWVERFPPEKRAKFLQSLRPRVQSAPSLIDWGRHEFIEVDNQRISIFRELVEELDAMQAQLRLERPDA